MAVVYPLGPTRVLAIVLIAAGALALTYKGFTYTRDTDTAKLGPLELTVKDQRRVNVPVWAGVLVLAAGVGLLLVPNKKQG
jgi:hypothetical protein